MRRIDATVAAVGAVIVLLAVVGAAMRGGDARTFDVTFTPADAPLDGGTVEHTGEMVRERFTFTVEDANATHVRVAVRVAFVGGPGASSLTSILLTAPNGTTYEAEGTTESGGVAGTQPAAVADVLVPLAPAPQNRTVQASDADAAVHAAAPPPAAPAPWLGEWTLDVSSQAGPTPYARATTTWNATLGTWTVTATPLVDASK